MFRPTQFVILFAVFLCVYAAPAVEKSVEAPAGESALEKTDLKTDATTYLAHTYYGPALAYSHYYDYDWALRTAWPYPGAVVRSTGWGPYIVV